VQGKSFTEELRRFYLAAWKRCKRIGADDIWREAMGAARGAGGLAEDYARHILSSADPLKVDVDRRGAYKGRRRIWSEGLRTAPVEGASELVLDVVGVLDVPSGRGVWLYAYSPSYRRFLVLRAKPSNPQGFAARFRFRRAAVRAEKGSLCFAAPLNKVYRFGRGTKLSFRLLGGVEELPCVSPEELSLIMRGLVPPNLLVEAPAPKADGNLAPDLGVIVPLKGASVEQVSGDRAVIKAGGAALALNSSYAPPEWGGGCLVALLLMGRAGGLKGYFLGGLNCECAEGAIEYYVPSQLYVKMRGEKVAELLGGLPEGILEYYERPVRGKIFIESRVLPKAGILQRAYRRYAGEVFKVPNPELIKYREIEAWLRYADVARALG